MTAGIRKRYRRAAMSELRFECTECGQCCRQRGVYAYVYVNEEECERLASHLGLTPAAFNKKHTFIDEDGWRQLSMDDQDCRFLDPEGRCTVYEARPVQCRTFPFWRELVGRSGFKAEAGRICEGVGRGRRYGEAEAETLMAAKERADELE